MNTILSILLFLLFRITGSSAQSPSYVLATNRYVDVAILDTIPGVFSAFDRCQTVVTEFAFSDIDALSAMRQLEMKPALSYSLVRDSIMARRLGYDPSRSMDGFFPLVAQSKGMQVVGLDAVGETLWMLFSRLDEEQQAQKLQSLMDFPEYDVDLEREIMRLYRRGMLWDIAYAVAGPDNQATLSAGDYEIYAKRNKVWADRLRPYLRAGGCFIALDAMYLGGEKGLLEALRAAGYKVKPIKK